MPLEKVKKQLEYEMVKIALFSVFEKMLNNVKNNGFVILKDTFSELSAEEQEIIINETWKAAIENERNKIENNTAIQKQLTKEDFSSLDFNNRTEKPHLTKEEFLNLDFSSYGNNNAKEKDEDSFEYLFNEDPSERLADESALHKLGYTVSQERGLSAKQRQQILEFAISSKMMSKRKVVSFLEYLIKTNGQKKNNEIALSKWKADLEYIRKY